MDNKAKRELIDAALDPRKIILYCNNHQYFGPVKLARAFHAHPETAIIRDNPMPGCIKCWQVYFMHEIGSRPASEQKELLEQLERNIANAAQLEDAGLYDFVVSPKPEITFTKE